MLVKGDAFCQKAMVDSDEVRGQKTQSMGQQSVPTWREVTVEANLRKRDDEHLCPRFCSLDYPAV